ncbi:MAG: hypothetical protein M3Z01_01485, partial [Thermoproteota archaeon]|nr:hypothetical protein [Thermoproteota archaeon]
KTHILFKSFSYLTIKEFDDIYDKEIIKIYEIHEIKPLSCKGKRKRKRKYGVVGIPFKLDVRDRILMLLV